MRIKNIQWKDALTIVKACDLLKPRAFAVLGFYYTLTLLNAFLDGIGIILIINLLTLKTAELSGDPLLTTAIRFISKVGMEPNAKNLLLMVSSLFIARAILYFALLSLDGFISSTIRRKIQEQGFTRVLNGSWEFLRDLRIGQYVGALTEEANLVTKYLNSIIRALYFLITSLVLYVVALTVSLKITMIMTLVGIPMVLLLQLFFFIQSKLSVNQTIARQGFTADVAERLTNLFQIKVEPFYHHHLQSGLKHQKQMARLEILIGYCQAAIGAWGVILPAVALLSFFAWSIWRGEPLSQSLHLLAGIGMVGARAAMQFNGFVASWGNLSRLSGSIQPVLNLFSVPPDGHRMALSEKLARVELNNVTYSYNGSIAVKNVSLSVEMGKPLAIRGPSGSGKTTLANLMAGVFYPHEGMVGYVGLSGEKYDAKVFKARIGYVTQDISLFHGSVRNNLHVPDSPVSDQILWQYLERVGADGFIQEMGGLDAQIMEFGRSLSGGEKRRLGIARVLVRTPDLLILDEIMSGLDPVKKQEIAQIINNLSQSMVVIAITHDPFEFDTWNQWNMT